MKNLKGDRIKVNEEFGHILKNINIMLLNIIYN